MQNLTVVKAMFILILGRDLSLDKESIYSIQRDVLSLSNSM